MNNELVLDERRLPERVVNDLRRYLQQRSLTIGEASTSKFNGGEIHGGQVVLRGLDCAVDLYLSSDGSLFVLCAKPEGAWTFGECFPEIPNEASVKDFFFDAPPEFKEPLLSKVGLAESVWVLISTADEKLIEQKVHSILAKLDTWPKDGQDTRRLAAGLNMFGWPYFGESDPLRGDELLKAVLPENWDLTVQASVKYHDGAPVLSLPIPLVNNLSLGPCKLTDLTVWLSMQMYYVRRAPDVRLEAALELNSEKFTFTADYPLDGDIVEAQLAVETGKRPPFIGDTPGLPELTGPDIELAVGLSLSKSEKALKKAYLNLLLRKKWVIAPDVLEIANPEFHFLVLDPVATTRRVVARIAGDLTIVGSTLAVSGNYTASDGYSEGQFAVALDPQTPLSLAALIKHLLRQDAVPSALREYTLDTLLFEYDLNGHIFMETSVSVPWNILLTGTVSLDFTQLRFLFEKWGDSMRFRAGADLELGGVRFSLSGDYSSANGWLFQGATYPGDPIHIGKFVEDLANQLHLGKDLPASIEEVSCQDIALSFNTATKDLTFAITTTFPVGEKEVEAIVTIKKADKSFEFGGRITLSGAEFTLDFESSGTKKVLTATWEKTDGKPGLDLMTLSDHGVAGLEDFGTLLRPKKATLTLNLEEDAKTLDLSCDLEQGAAALRIAKREDRWIAAIGFNAPKISTESLGPLGSALRPHNIALDKLVIMAASADAPQESRLTLGEQEYPVTKGLLLQGALEFEGTSFSAPFECRLGGDQSDEQPKELLATGSTSQMTAVRAPSSIPTGQTLSVASSEPEEGKNNVTVGRTIGPVTFRRARLESHDKRIYVLLDASLGSGGFELDLTGFNVNFPLALLQNPKGQAREIEVGLDGLSIYYSKPPLSMSGGFARTKGLEGYEGAVYQGHLLIKAEAFQITVLGSYGNIKINGEKKPSLFLFGAYAGVVGGPPAFFVTGLALGGGYNTQLALPPIEKVAKFPLVQVVTDPGKFTQDRLREAVLPSYGDYWLAIGVKFTSFKLADSFALFSVAFGTRLQFALLGLTKFTVPTGAEEGKCAVYAELAIRAMLDPEAGVFSIEGQLTQNSYVLAKEFRLTGGFAFFIWFGNAQEAGDFVISLGGYHPTFHAPSHYPLVPRVGILGQIGALTVKGEAYLALTPSCLMAGLKLEAVFQRGRIRAAFIAYADFIIAWAPFHYDAQIGIGIAVAVRLWRTFKVELSASLHVWGPPFAGRARVSYWIVSFTVEFGDTSGTKPPPLQWDEFQKAFLPPDPEAKHALLSTIRITEGLVREVKRGEGENEVMYRIVNPHELMIETDSVVPCTEVCVGTAPPKTGTAKIGIRPMEARTLTSRHTVSIKTCDGDSAEEKFKPVQWSQKNFPEALWSPSQASGKPEADMVKDVPSGVVLRVQPKTPEHILGPFLIEKFKWEEIPKSIPWSDLKLPTAIDEQFSKVAKKNKLREQIRDCLVERVVEPGKSSWNEIDMTNTSANSKEYFKAPPMCAALGQSI